MQKIKDVMRISGVSRRTLQYYDDLGLLTVKRTKENYRLYSEEDMERLWKILCYKEMGFRLEEIKLLLDSDKEVVHEALQKRYTDIRDQIVELKRLGRFIEKVDKYGLPRKPADLAAFTGRGVTYRDMAKRFPER